MILYLRFQNPHTQKFIHMFIVIPFGGQASTEPMGSYLHYVFNPLSMNVDSHCCRNINIFDYELLVQSLLGCYVQYRDHITFLKCEN